MEKRTEYFYYNGKSIPYIIEYKDIKRIILKIDKNNKIKVSCSKNISKLEIYNFFMNNIEKILSMKEKKDNSTKFNLEKQKIWFFGKEINFEIIISSGNNKYKFINNKLYLYLRSKDDVEKIIKKFYKENALNYIPKRLKELSSLTNLKYNELKIKWTESKWGHCDSYNNILISSKLIINDYPIIDYVLIHELCHTIYKNHSNEFWNLVEKLYPNYKLARKILKEI